MEALKHLFNPNHKAQVSNTQSTPAALSTAPHSNVTATFKDLISFLKDLGVVVLVDDSTSMAGSRWREVARALQALAGKVAKYDEYCGVKIQFLNSSEILTTASISQDTVPHLENFPLIPKTPIGLKLGKLLDKYTKHLKTMGSKLKPAIFVVVTDGVATDGAQTEEAILRTAKALADLKYNNAKPERKQIRIQFVQVGNEPKATDYLQRLGDTLTSQARNRVVVGATPSKPGIELDLVKVLLDIAN